MTIGADEVIDYNKEDFEKKLRDIDFVLDTVGGDTLSKVSGFLCLMFIARTDSTTV